MLGSRTVAGSARRWNQCDVHCRRPREEDTTPQQSVSSRVAIFFVVSHRCETRGAADATAAPNTGKQQRRCVTYCFGTITLPAFHHNLRHANTVPATDPARREDFFSYPRSRPVPVLPSLEEMISTGPADHPILDQLDPQVMASSILAPSFRSECIGNPSRFYDDILPLLVSPYEKPKVLEGRQVSKKLIKKWCHCCLIAGATLFATVPSAPQRASRSTSPQSISSRVCCSCQFDR
jgi:hypothetical protein